MSVWSTTSFDPNCCKPSVPYSITQVYTAGNYAVFEGNCWVALYWNTGQWWYGYKPGYGDAWTKITNYWCP